MANGIKVDLEDFNKLSTVDDKVDAIFKNTAFLITQNQDCNNRITALESSRKKHLASATGSGGLMALVIMAGEYVWAKMSGG